MKIPYATCELLNGSVCRYDAACQPGEGRCYAFQAFVYIGRGHVFNIRNNTYDGGPLLDFFVLRPGRPKWAR